MSEMKIEADCLKELPGVSHGFFTRHGGVSKDDYATLNCGFGSKDDAGNIAENRAMVAGSLGTQLQLLMTPHQYHSAEAITVKEPFARDQAPKADAAVTATPGLAVAVLTADCAPVLFADDEAGVVAAAHSGWRGALNGVLDNTVHQMEALGAHRANIAAAVGPAISAPSYEVGPEFEAQFLQADTDNARFFSRNSPGSRPHFDLPGYVNARLEGLSLGAIGLIGHCTYQQNEQYFSYRRTVHRDELDYGRQISAIMLV